MRSGPAIWAERSVLWQETGKKTGKTTIHLTTEEGGYQASCEVTVEIYVSNIHMRQNIITLDLKGKKKLQADIYPSGRTIEKILWKSENPEVASVDLSGTVTAKSIGKAKVVVYDRYTGAYDFAIVRVRVNLATPKLTATTEKKKIKLSWKKVKRATNYIIYKYNKKTKKYEKIKSLTKDKKKYTVSKVEKKDKFKIRALYRKDGKKEYSKYSNNVTVK